MTQTNAVNNQVRTAIPGQTTVRDEAALRQVAKQFESLFMNQLMKSMRETVPMSDLIDNQGEIRYYRQMLDEEMSKHMANSPGGLGIADSIVDQYKAYLPKPEEVDEAEPLQAADQSADTRLRLQKAMAAYGEAGSTTSHKQAPAEIIGPLPADIQDRAAAAGTAVADTLRTYESEIMTASRESGMAPELLLAVIMQESGGNPTVESRAGAQGLMQLMPETAEELGVRDSFDPQDNVVGGARYLSWLHDRYQGDVDLMLAGYNAGPGNVDRAGKQIPPFDETINYVSKVKTLYNQLMDNESGNERTQ
jgi:soluble lytic murein transglycosylase-like protein